MPDFIAETDEYVLMVETKMRTEMDDSIVLDKARAGATWCQNASDYLLKNGGKKWRYLLIPHDEVKEHNTLESYVDLFEFLADK